MINMLTVSNNLSFQSKIKFVAEYPTFDKLYRTYCNSSHFVDYPWTIETMKTGINLGTWNVKDCLAAIITDGIDSAAIHLATRNDAEAKKDNVTKFDIKNIKAVLSEKFDLGRKGLHGILLGGWNSKLNPAWLNIPNKRKEYKELSGLFRECKIPMTEICQRRYVTRSPYDDFGQEYYHLLYIESDDTFYISNSATGWTYEDKYPQREVDIYPDGVEYSVYKRVIDKQGMVYYKESRKKSSVENYLKSQFEIVSLRNGDYFAKD